MTTLYDVYKHDLKLGGEAIASDPQFATQVQVNLIRLGFLTPPADGKWGPISQKSLACFQAAAKLIPDGVLGKKTAEVLIEAKDNDYRPKLNLKDNLAGKIIRYCQAKQYPFSTNFGEYSIIYIEGINSDGTLNNDRPNHFNDLRVVLSFRDNEPAIEGMWEATTEPGSYYTYNPMNSGGAARIAFGWYKAWRVGTHGNAEPHEALIQSSPVKVYRDFNKDFARTGDRLDTGLFGINQHWGYDYPVNNISYASAGCLVGRTRSGHKKFMGLIKSDNRYLINKNYLFETIVIPGNEL